MVTLRLVCLIRVRYVYRLLLELVDDVMVVMSLFLPLPFHVHGRTLLYLSSGAPWTSVR